MRLWRLRKYCIVGNRYPWNDSLGKVMKSTSTQVVKCGPRFAPPMGMATREVRHGEFDCAYPTTAAGLKGSAKTWLQGWENAV